MKDLSPLEAGRWMDAAPQTVQDAVVSPVTQEVIEQLGQRYKLHVDIVGLIYKLTSYMLVGYIGPEEAFKELKMAGIPEVDARNIMTDINQGVFVPLHEKMRRGTETTSDQAAHSPRTTVQNPPVKHPLSTAPSEISQQPGSHFHLQNKIGPPPRNNPMPSAPSFPSAKPVDSSRLLEDHEEPHIDFHTAPKAAPVPPNLPGQTPNAPVRTPFPNPNVSRPIAPRVIPPGARAFTPPSIPVNGPANIPAKEPPQPIAPSAAPAPQKPAASAPPAPPAGPAKPYSADPYREPIDETDV
jgi:hypothetical protein